MADKKYIEDLYEEYYKTIHRRDLEDENSVNIPESRTHLSAYEYIRLRMM